MNRAWGLLLVVGSLSLATPANAAKGPVPTTLFGIGSGTLQSKVLEILGEPGVKTGDVDYEEWQWTKAEGAVTIDASFNTGDARVQMIYVYVADDFNTQAPDESLAGLSNDPLFEDLTRPLADIQKGYSDTPTRSDQYGLMYDVGPDGAFLDFLPASDKPNCWQVSLSFTYPEEIPDWAVAPKRLLRPGTEDPAAYSTFFGVPLGSPKPAAEAKIKAPSRLPDPDDPSNVFYTPEDAPISVSFEYDSNDEANPTLSTVTVDAGGVYDPADLPAQIEALKALGLDDPVLGFLGETKETIVAQLGDAVGYQTFSYTYRLKSADGTDEYLEIDFAGANETASAVYLGVSMD